MHKCGICEERGSGYDKIKGIAYHTLELLMAEVRKRGIKHISLEATDMGRPLYERCGFVDMKDEMEYPEEK